MASLKPEEGTIMPSNAKYKADSSPIIQGFGCRALENNLGWNHLGGFCVQLPASLMSDSEDQLLDGTGFPNYRLLQSKAAVRERFLPPRGRLQKGLVATRFLLST